MLGFSRWRHRHLLAAWVVYWIGLIAVKLGGAVRAVLQVSGPNAHGSASAGFGDGGITFTVVNAAGTLWSGVSSFSALALWIAGPPLLLWVAWMLKRPRPDVANTAASATSPWEDPNRVRSVRAPEASFTATRRDEEVPARRPSGEHNG